MIIQNGKIRTITKAGGGMEKGRPVPVKESIGEPIPCNIKTVRNNLHGKSIDGIFRQTELEVLIETCESPVFGADTVEVSDNRGKSLGRFFVQNIEFMDFVQAIKIDLAHAD